MQKRRWELILVVAMAWLLANCQPVFGSGFSLYEVGSRSTALCGTVVARADDLSAIFFNPAGITQLPGLRLMGGFATIIPSTDIVTDLGPFTTKNRMKHHVFFPLHFFASYQALNRVWLGIGVFSPFGLGVDFNAHWPGSINNIKTFITTVNINPTVAVKITDWFSLGAGINIMYFDLEMKRLLPLPIIGFQSTLLKGDSYGIGFNLGFHAKPLSWLSVGISYRSQVKQEVDGTATFSPASFLNADASGSIILPDMIFTGIMVRPIEKLTVEAGFIWTHWSLFKSLDIKFDNLLGTLSEPKQWHDTWRAQLGIEYKALNWLDLRFGYAYDEEPMPSKFADYIVPTPSDRHSFSLGAGFHWHNWSLDLSYLFQFMPNKRISDSKAVGFLPSEYNNRHGHVFGLSLSYKFQGK